MGGPEVEGVASSEEGPGRFSFCGPTTGEPGGRWGARPRLGSADWRGCSREPRPSGGGRERSREPEPDTASLRGAAAAASCQVTSCDGPPRALSPRCSHRDSSSPPVPGAAASSAPSGRRGRLFLENFCESFHVLKKNFFLLLTAGLLLSGSFSITSQDSQKFL